MPWRESTALPAMLTVLCTSEGGEPQAQLLLLKQVVCSVWATGAFLTWSCPNKLDLTYFT